MDNMNDWLSVAKLLQPLTLGTLLIVILITGYLQKWVWGWQLKDMTADRDFWRSHALASMRIAESTTTPAETRR